MRLFNIQLALLLSVVLTPTGVFSFLVLKRTSGPTSVNLQEPTSISRSGKSLRHNSWKSSTSLRGGEGLSEESPQSTAAVATGPSETSIPGGSEAYYLLWSPKFVPKLALATILLAVSRHLRWDHRLFGLLAGSDRYLPSGLFSNVVLPLLSSSCCAIQLAANAVSVAVLGAGAGCIGFNTFLGPVRPYLLAVMVVNMFQSSPLTMLVRYAIALMPELVFGWNEVIRSNWRRRSLNAATEEVMIQATMIVEVPTMGCVACVNKIESSLRNKAPDKIETASSWLNPKPKIEGGKKGGRAKIEVKVASQDELENLAQSLVGAIEDAGFQGTTIETLEIQQAKKSSDSEEQ